MVAVRAQGRGVGLAIYLDAELLAGERGCDYALGLGWQSLRMSSQS